MVQNGHIYCYSILVIDSMGAEHLTKSAFEQAVDVGSNYILATTALRNLLLY